MNAIFQPINLAKWWGFDIPVAIQGPNGYPTSDPGDVVVNPSLPLNYFGDYVWKWQGTGSMKMLTVPLLVRSGYSSFGGSLGSTGDVSGDVNIQSRTSPRIQLAFGALIRNVSDSRISNGAGGTYVKITTKANGAQFLRYGVPMKIQLIVGQGNALGEWNCVQIDNSSFYLKTNSNTGAPSTYNPADPYSGPGGEVISQGQNLAVFLAAGGTWNGFKGLVFCSAPNEALVDAGKTVDPAYIAQLQYLKPGWLRFMDLNGVQASYENNFANRMTASDMHWTSDRYVPAYWTSSGIIWNSGDAYTCASPTSSPATGPYKDNEIVQGVIDRPNRSMLPTLNVNGRGAKPIVDFQIQPLKFRLSGSLPAKGTTISLTFTAPFINGGTPYTLSYVVGSGGSAQPDTNFFNLQTNIATKCNADATLSGKLFFGNSGFPQLYQITGQVGTLTVAATTPSGTFCSIIRLDPYNLAHETGQIRMLFGGAIGPGHMLTLTFTRADLPGGSHALQYTTVATDSSLQKLCASLNTAINGNALLRAAAISANPSGLPAKSLNIQQGDSAAGGGLSLTFSSTGPETCNFSPAGSGAKGTFIYSYLLDAWVWRPGSMLRSVPFEYLVELCNSVGAGCYFNWPINTNSQFITDVTNYFRLNLNGTLKFGAEVGNEMWNFGQSPWGRAQTLGFALGFSPGGNNPNYSFVGLRIKQYGDLAIAAWTASRSRSDLYLFNQSATWDFGNTDRSQFRGSSLDARTNTIYARYGGLDGEAGSTKPVSSHNVAPNRPIDICDAVGMAPYIGSMWNNGFTSDISGTIASYAPFLTAALQYGRGDTSSAYTTLQGMLAGTITRTGGNANGGTLLYYAKGPYTQLETILRSYDAGRATKLAAIFYEGGPQFGVGNINNGTNSSTVDIPAVASQITSNNWDVSPYTVSGANNATEMATQIVGLIYSFKFSSQYKALYKQYLSDVAKVFSDRPYAANAQYGYFASQWGLFDSAGKAYSSYDAIHEYNNGI